MIVDMDCFTFFNNRAPPAFIGIPNGSPAPRGTMWRWRECPGWRTFMHSYPLLAPNQPPNLPPQQRVAFPVTPYDTVEVQPDHRVPRYVVGSAGILIIPPASQLIPAEELVVFAPVAAHGPVDALPQYSVIECQELYAPQAPRLILLAPSDLFDLPPLAVPNPCYTGERYMLTPIVTELQFNLQLDEEEGGEAEGRETEGPTADLINTTDDDAVDRAIKRLIRNYVGKQQPSLTTATNSLKLRKQRPS
jgi:hypothetical protein